MALSLTDLAGCVVVTTTRAPQPLAEFAPSRGRRTRPLDSAHATSVAGAAGAAGAAGIITAAVPLKRLRPCGLTSLPTYDDVTSEGDSLGDTASTGHPSRPSSIQRDASFARSLASSGAIPRTAAGLRSPSRASSFSDSLNLDDGDSPDAMPGVILSAGSAPEMSGYKYCLSV